MGCGSAQPAQSAGCFAVWTQRATCEPGAGPGRAQLFERGHAGRAHANTSGSGFAAGRTCIAAAGEYLPPLCLRSLGSGMASYTRSGEREVAPLAAAYQASLSGVVPAMGCGKRPEKSFADLGRSEHNMRCMLNNALCRNALASSRLVFVLAATCSPVAAQGISLPPRGSEGGISAIWIFANLSFTGMRAQGAGTTFWKVVTFVLGFPGTLLTFLVVARGSERAYGIDMPRKRSTY
jgi:hypothetical protein